MLRFRFPLLPLMGRVEVAWFVMLAAIPSSVCGPLSASLLRQPWQPRLVRIALRLSTQEYVQSEVNH